MITEFDLVLIVVTILLFLAAVFTVGYWVGLKVAYRDSLEVIDGIKGRRRFNEAMERIRIFTHTERENECQLEEKLDH